MPMLLLVWELPTFRSIRTRELVWIKIIVWIQATVLREMFRDIFEFRTVFEKGY